MAKERMVKVRRLTLSAGPGGVEPVGTELEMTENEANEAVKARFVEIIPANSKKKTDKDGE